MHTNLLAICFYPEKLRKVVLIYLDVFCAHVRYEKKNSINILVCMPRPSDTFTFSHHFLFALQTVFASTFPLQVEHISTICITAHVITHGQDVKKTSHPIRCCGEKAASVKRKKSFFGSRGLRHVFWLPQSPSHCCNQLHLPSISHKRKHRKPHYVTSHHQSC